MGREGGKPWKICGANIPKFSTGFINSFVHDCRLGYKVISSDIYVGSRFLIHGKFSFTETNDIKFMIKVKQKRSKRIIISWQNSYIKVQNRKRLRLGSETVYALTVFKSIEGARLVKSVSLPNRPRFKRASY